MFSRGTVDEVKALDNINLDVNALDFITVIGSNGAGKTTLLNVIADVYPPEKGGGSLLTAKMLPISVNISALNISAGSIRILT